MSLTRTMTFASALSLAAFCWMGTAEADESERVQRKIAVVEKIFDTSLIDSKYALVSSGENARGVYLEGLGALFTLEFSFVEEPHRKILENLDDLDDLVKNWRDLLEMDEEGRAAAGLRRRALLEKVKDELAETMVDYGGTLSFLADNETVTLVAFPWGETWDVSPEPLSHLIIRLGAADLKAAAEGLIDMETALSRMHIEEW